MAETGGPSSIVDLGAVRAAVEAARPFEAKAKAAAASGPSAGAEPPSPPPEPREDGLPDDCPVTALGVEGDAYYFLDQLKQLRQLLHKEMARLPIMSLFGTRADWLFGQWPRYAKRTALDGSPIIDGWRPEEAAKALMSACARRGIWSKRDRCRGSGGWRGDAGELILHCGDEVLVCADDGQHWHEPGMIGRYVYPGGAALPRPVAAAVAGGDGGPAQTLRTLLGHWAWSRPELDPVLALGWIGCGLLGAALDWRPLLWITGGKGTGKSWLRKMLIDSVFDGALLAVDDTSSAGIWQPMQHSTIAVWIDEAEAKADDRRIQDVISLARIAASGGVIRRGGADHRGVEFTARSAFAFASINVPGLLSQDASRIAVLQLDELGQRPTPNIPAAQVREIGRMLRGRLVRGWPRLAGLLDWYRAEAMAPDDTGARLDARAADLYGALLAVAELLLWDERDDAGGAPAAWMQAVRAVGNEHAVMRDEQMFIDHLLSTVVTPVPSERRTIAQLVHAAADWVANEDPAVRNRQLGTYGLKVIVDHAGKAWLAIARQHQGLAALLKDTHWGARAGTTAVWVQAAERLARTHGGDTSSEPVWFAGVTKRAVRVPLDAICPREMPAQGVLGC